MTFCNGMDSISTYCIVKQSTYGPIFVISFLLAIGCFICALIQGKEEKKEREFRKFIAEKLKWLKM